MIAKAMLISGVGRSAFAKGTLFVLIVLACSSGCEQATDRKAEIASGCPNLHTLEASSARLAAARAVQSGNDQLLAVRGYAIDIPGVPDVQAAKKKYGIVIISGTSDAPANRTCDLLNVQAISNAEIYNRTVISLTR